MSRRVQCINKLPRQNPHERIQNIGGVENNVRWKRTQSDAIADVQRDPSSYWVTDKAGNSVWVIVRLHNNHPYLTTQADGDSQNNLLSLPECP